MMDLISPDDLDNNDLYMALLGDKLNTIDLRTETSTNQSLHQLLSIFNQIHNLLKYSVSKEDMTTFFSWLDENNLQTDFADKIQAMDRSAIALIQEF